MTKKHGLLIVGAGGHGKIVADAAHRTEIWERIAFLDDLITEPIFEWPVLGRIGDAKLLLKEYPDLVIGIGDNFKRVELLKEYAKLGFNIPSIIHPSAYISDYSVISSGCVIFAQAVVNIGAKVSCGCIINTGATVDHDCILDEGVHISPGAHLAGGVKIGRYSWVGIGASVIQQISIGDNVVIGAGSAVINSVENNATVVGVPGRVIKKNE